MTQTLTLPRASLRPEKLSRLKVLVVDDHVLTGRLIGDVLRAAGVGHVETAPDGQRARGIINIWNPDIVFTDWHMPVMDGLALTRLIRQAAISRDPTVPNPEVPVIMLTARRSLREVESARLAGVNEFVIKPFTPAALISRIQLVLKKPRPFIISDVYVGPDRRRRVEISYAGPLRRAGDPDEVVDRIERDATRETIGVELDALRRLIRGRGGMDRQIQKMTYRVMEHTRFRARQVRDDMVEQVAQLLLDYADARGGPEACDPAVLEIHLDAIHTLLAAPGTDVALAEKVMSNLRLAVQKKMKTARAA